MATKGAKRGSRIETIIFFFIFLVIFVFFVAFVSRPDRRWIPSPRRAD
jgi:hypothetical protein